MDIYCTSKNYGPSLGLPDQVTMVYLGTSLEDAEKAVGDFAKYLRTNYDLRQRTYLYTALPIDIESELVKYYMTDGWWYTIVKFELLDPPLTGDDIVRMFPEGWFDENPPKECLCVLHPAIPGVSSGFYEVRDDCPVHSVSTTKEI